jgi:hypothetical protein
MLNDRTEILFETDGASRQTRPPQSGLSAVRATAALSARTVSPSQPVDPVGLPVFSNLVDAIRAGYHVLDGTPDGYVVRIRTVAGWTRALVKCR